MDLTKLKEAVINNSDLITIKIKDKQGEGKVIREKTDTKPAIVAFPFKPVEMEVKDVVAIGNDGAVAKYLNEPVGVEDVVVDHAWSDAKGDWVERTEAQPLTRAKQLGIANRVHHIDVAKAIRGKL